MPIKFKAPLLYKSINAIVLHIIIKIFMKEVFNLASEGKNKKTDGINIVSFNDSNYVNINNASKYGVKNKRKYVSGDTSRSSANHRFSPLGTESEND